MRSLVVYNSNPSGVRISTKNAVESQFQTAWNSCMFNNFQFRQQNICGYKQIQICSDGEPKLDIKIQGVSKDTKSAI